MLHDDGCYVESKTEEISKEWGEAIILNRVAKWGLTGKETFEESYLRSQGTSSPWREVEQSIPDKGTVAAESLVCWRRGRQVSVVAGEG